jgi:hypothetical protein
MEQARIAVIDGMAKYDFGLLFIGPVTSPYVRWGSV